MTQARRFLRRLVTLFRSSRAESELSREINAHLQLLEDKHVAQGMSRDEARYAARRAFGGVEQAKEQQRDARSFRWLAGWPMDLKLGARMLVKSPGLTVVAVTALAIAIGAGAAYFEVMHDLISPRLPVAGADRIVGIRVWNAERRAAELQSLQDVAVWRANTRSIEHLGAARPISRHLTTADGRTEPARGIEISASAFRLYPVAPLHGRTLDDDDERPDADAVAVIGHDLWRERFNSDPNAVGSTVRLGSTAHTIVGVMPEGFGFPVNENLWVPLRTDGLVIQVFGRLKAGASAAAAQAELSTFAVSAATVDKPVGPVLRMDVRPYIDSLNAEDLESLEMVVIRAVNFVFIMLLGLCGANVATLVFARTAMREAEITVRTALGATRGRISAQLFAEALVLSSLAAGAGLLAARFVGQWAKSLYVQGIGPTPFWWDDGLSYPTMLYAVALAVFAALIVGVIPALKATGPQLQGRIRDAASGASTMKFGGLWTAIIVTQAAITVIVLAAVVSFGWTQLRKQWGSDVTYARDQLLTAHVVVDQVNAGRAQPPSAETLQAIAERLSAEPSVASVSYTTALPGTIWEQVIFEFQSPELHEQADARKDTDVLWSEGARVGANFFETVGIPLAAGRTFSAAEIRQGAPVAIVDETFVRSVLGGRSPFGVRLRQRAEQAGREPGPWLEIVGVVKDATTMPRKTSEDSALYRPAAPAQPMRLLVRTHGAASPMTQRIYAAARSAHPDIRLADLKSLADVAYDDALPERIFLRAFIVVGAIALLLATAGIYALVSFTLARRTREIGIRVALGAAPRRIMTVVFARAFMQIGLGVAAGFLPGLVIMVSGSDDAGAMNTRAGAVATLGVCAFVVLVALISCTVPLRRALGIQPTEALRTS
ncbi:MAG TPA: ABC transporter permease [Vicinamibacterales bacterium]|nr:ABC transporter permease [Vicinamibacterales bacterium]